MTWRCASAITDCIRCRGRFALDSDSAESALYLISTSGYDLPLTMTTTEVPGFQCVSANDLPRP